MSTLKKGKPLYPRVFPYEAVAVRAVVLDVLKGLEEQYF